MSGGATISGRAQWLNDPDLQRLLAVLSEGGEEARVAGGAVRNTLLGEAVTDVAIATPNHPEETLRRAYSNPRADGRVRQNLALVVGLQGRFAEAETIAKGDLPAEQAAANVAYLREMLSRKDDPRNGGKAVPVAALNRPD